MKLSLIISLFVLSTVAFAEKGENFEDHKKMMLEGLSGQIAALQTNKSCIEAAGDHEALKKCQETAKADRKKMHAKKIDKKIKHLEEEKKKLEEKQ